MSDTFVTSDHHFSHYNIIKYSNRPFENIKEMDECLIENWNKTVKPNDVVWHLGDLIFCKYPEDIEKLMKKLNGRINYITGNHDKIIKQNISRLKHLFNFIYYSYHEEYVNNQPITFCHYAMRVWNKSHHGAWHLYGHSHGSLQDDPNSLSFDVGVDCHNYTPLHFDRIKEIMSKKVFKPIDHHGK